MRLYLSSLRVGSRPDRLLELVGTSRTAVVVANALDAATRDERTAGLQRDLDDLAELGIAGHEVDLRQLVGRSPGDVLEALAGEGLIWVRGGNTFTLRQALAACGADDALRSLLAGDRVAYGGYSAGAAVLAPSLRGFEMVNDAERAEQVSGRPVRWDGLGVLDFIVVPHCDSPGYPETGRFSALATHYRQRGVPHRALRDGQVIVVDGDRLEVW